MIHDVNRGAPMSPTTGITRGTSRRSVHQPAEQDGVEGGDAGPQDEGRLIEGGERGPGGNQGCRIGCGCGRLTQNRDRDDAQDADEQDRGLEHPRCHEAEREALVLALHDGVERDRGPDGRQAIDDVEEGGEADLAVGACAEDVVRSRSARSRAAGLPGSSWRR